MPASSILGFVAWPLAIGAAIAVFATSSDTALSLLHQNWTIGGATTIKTGVPAPVIRIPSTPIVAPEAARAKVAALVSGRDYAVASASTAVPAAGPAKMTAKTGLMVRSQPKAGSPAVGAIAKGATVEVRSKRGAWLLVQTSTGATGWVFGKYLLAASANAAT